MKPNRLSSALFAASLTLAACSGAAETSNEGGDYTLTPIVNGLEIPWSMAFLPNGDMLVTERAGRLRLVRNGALVDTPVSGTPNALIDGQGGYLGLALDPNFDDTRLVYLAYSKGEAGANATAVVRGRLSDDATALSNVEEIFVATERNTSYHFGGRLEFLGDGTLLVSLGDAFRLMDEAQNAQNSHGAIVRINADGSIPEDNPAAGATGMAAKVFSYGHRNVQGLAYDAERDIIYAHEHGPKGGDELNVIEAGRNYGWPEITYGVNYDGSVITTETERDGLEQPVTYWVPSIAPSGMELISGETYPGWSGDLLIAAMNGPKGQKLVRIDLEDGAFVDRVDLFSGEGLPYRDVAQAPDGKIYLVSDYDGQIFRIDPAPAES
ncbi:MAG: PQQ-dependent sugar dehydrogenase [Pseudomonadota bacterium]